MAFDWLDSLWPSFILGWFGHKSCLPRTVYTQHVYAGRLDSWLASYRRCLPVYCVSNLPGHAARKHTHTLTHKARINMKSWSFGVFRQQRTKLICTQELRQNIRAAALFSHFFFFFLSLSNDIEPVSSLWYVVFPNPGQISTFRMKYVKTFEFFDAKNQEPLLGIMMRWKISSIK